MSEALEVDGFDGEDAPAEAPRRKLSGKKLVMFAGLPLAVAGAVGGYVGGFFDSRPPHDPVATEMQAPAPIPVRAVFYDLPEMIVNLSDSGRRPAFLKIQVSLELTSDSDVGRVNDMRPRIVDSFQVYLRELRIEDLRGSAGIYRLREELLARINESVAPVRVRNVLFKEVLVQ